MLKATQASHVSNLPITNLILLCTSQWLITTVVLRDGAMLETVRRRKGRRVVSLVKATTASALIVVLHQGRLLLIPNWRMASAV
jgi:hypothetical protein